ncbi:TSC22 domain family protein 3 isoform 2-T2 [Sylvia borin]
MQTEFTPSPSPQAGACVPPAEPPSWVSRRTETARSGVRTLVGWTGGARTLLAADEGRGEAVQIRGDTVLKRAVLALGLAVLWFNWKSWRGCREGQNREAVCCTGGSTGVQCALSRGSTGVQWAVPRAVPEQPPARRCGRRAVPAVLAPPGRAGTADISGGGGEGPAVRFAPSVRVCVATAAMSTGMYQSPMEVAVYQLHNFSISFFSSLLGGDVVSVKLDNSASGASVVAIDNKIEQAMVSCSAAPSPPTFPHHPVGAVPGGGLPAPGSCEKSSDVCCAGGGGGPERANQGTVGEKLPAGA